MTKKFSTKRSLIASILVLCLCITSLAGTTFAWFTDAVSSNNNIIKSGRLDVELEYATVKDGQISGWSTVEKADKIFDPNALWEPGRVEVVYLKVSNRGNLALKYQLAVNVVGEDPGTNVYGDPFKLSEHLVFKVVEMPDALTTYTDHEAVATAAGTETGLKDHNGKTTALEVGDVDYVALIVYMPENVGNVANYRGDAVPTIKLGVNLYATQKTTEQDSFGPDYDENAWHEKFTVSTAEDLNAALANVKDGDVIEFASNITFTRDTAGYDDGTYVDGVRYTGDKSFTIDFNGYTLVDDGCVNDYLFYLNNKGEKQNEITLKNGTLVAKSGCWATLCVNSAASTQATVLNMENMSVTNSNDASYSGNTAVRARNMTTVNVNEGTTIISDGASYGIATNAADAIVNINNGATVIQKNSGSTAGNSVFAAVGGVGTVNINDGATIVSDKYGVHTMTTGTPVINVKGGTITADVALKASTNGGAGQLATINVTGGVINGKLETYTSNGHIVVSAGTFSADPSTYVADGYKAVQNIDGTYVVFKGELVVTNDAEIATAIAAGKTEIVFAPGNYQFPISSALSGKTLSIIGTKGVVIDTSKVDENNQFVTGATLTFDGVTLNFGKVNQMGFANTASLIYKNCDINGLQFLYGESVTFENCNLNSNGAEHCVWTYSAKNVSFVDCDFTYGDRGINCYKHNDIAGGKQTVSFTNCTFTTDNKASIGAVEINSIYLSVGIDVNMTKCTAPTNGEMVYVSEYDTTAGSKTNITVDGKDVYVAVVGNQYATDEVNGNILKAALQHDAEVINIKLLKNIDCYLTGGVGTVNTKEVNVTAVNKDVVLNITCSSDSYNGSYCTYRTVNPDAVMNFSNITLEKSKWSNTTWNTYNIEFYTDVTLTNCIVKHPITVCEKAVITDTVINTSEDTGNTFYSIWVQSGADLTVNGGEIIGNRGIKADGQYISYPGNNSYGDTYTDEKVTNVTVSDTKFTLTGSKPAILVKLEKANVVVSDVNIENVAKDAVNPVWIDEDAANNTTNITITVNGVKQDNAIIREQ